MAISEFTIVRRSMTARLFSTVTTVVTVAIAVALMLVLLGLRDSGRQAFSRGSGNMHLLVSRDASPLVSVLNGVFYANAPSRPILMREFEAFMRAPAGRRPPLEALTEWAIPTQLGDTFRGHPVMATTRAFFEEFEPVNDEPWALAEGEFFDEPFEAVLGADVARKTGLGVGQTIYLTHGTGSGDAVEGDVEQEQGGEHEEHADEHELPHDENEPADEEEAGDRPGAGSGDHLHHEFGYEIVGILEPTGSAHDRALFTDLTSSWIIHAQERRQRAAPAGTTIERTTESDLRPEDRMITGVYLRAAGRGGDASAVLPQVFEAIRRNPGYTVASPTDQIDRLFAIVGNIDQIFIGIAAVVMVSSGIAIMLALYNSMGQRRRQIAVLRVLGCSRGRIFGIVMTESALIGLLGAVVGIGLSVGGLVLVASVLERRVGLVIEPTLGPPLVLIVAAATVVLASMAGVVPAIAAYRTSVARNLRPLA